MEGTWPGGWWRDGMHACTTFNSSFSTSTLHPLTCDQSDTEPRAPYACICHTPWSSHVRSHQPLVVKPHVEAPFEPQSHVSTRYDNDANKLD